MLHAVVQWRKKQHGSIFSGFMGRPFPGFGWLRRLPGIVAPILPAKHATMEAQNSKTFLSWPYSPNTVSGHVTMAFFPRQDLLPPAAMDTDAAFDTLPPAAVDTEAGGPSGSERTPGNRWIDPRRVALVVGSFVRVTFL